MSELRMLSWQDVTATLNEDLAVWPDDPPLRLRRVSSMDEGEEANLTVIESTLHLGTHIDAPMHYVKDGAGIEAMPVDLMVGSVQVIEIDNPDHIAVADLRPYDLQGVQRIFFKTTNSRGRWPSQQFDERYVGVSPEAARYLVEHDVRVVGLDYLSIGPFDEEANGATHRTLLGAEVWVIEGLDLRHIEPGTYQMIALPLKIAGVDGAPARVLLGR
jgi:arylformamidase